MEPNTEGRQTPRLPVGPSRIEGSIDAPDLKPEDAELDAWLAAHEANLEEMAWAHFDHIDDREWQ